MGNLDFGRAPPSPRKKLPGSDPLANGSLSNPQLPSRLGNRKPIRLRTGLYHVSNQCQMRYQKFCSGCEPLVWASSGNCGRNATPARTVTNSFRLRQIAAELIHNRGSTGSLSSARTPNTHSCTRRSGSLRTNRSRPSMPRANSRRARPRLWFRPRCRSRSRCSGSS
jgi:hypothetical protein